MRSPIRKILSLSLFIIGNIPIYAVDEKAPLPDGVNVESNDGLGQLWFGKRVAVDTWGIFTAPFDWSGKEWAVAGGAVGVTVAAGLILDSSSQPSRDENEPLVLARLGCEYHVAISA